MTRSALLGGSVLLDKATALARHPRAFFVPNDFSLRIFATDWGFPGTVSELCAQAKEDGYDGIEVWYPSGSAD